MEGENIVNEEAIEMEFLPPTSTPEYIGASFNAIQSVSDMDTALMSNSDKERVRRIRRKALKIIDHCICELYDEIFDKDEDE